MVEKRVAYIVISISSLTVWELLFNFNLFNAKILTGLVLLSILVFGLSLNRLLIDYKFESKYFKFFLYVFFLYEFILIVRGWSFSYNDIKVYMQAGYIFWPFIIPLFVFFDKRLSTIGYLIKWIYYMGMFFLIIYLIFHTLLLKRVTAEILVSTTYVCGFILLNARYLRNRKVTLSFVLMSISLLSLIYVARSNGVVTISGFILAGYFINVCNKSRSFIFRFFPIIVCCAVFLMLSLTTFTTNLSAKLQARITEDTRSGLFKMFFVEMDDYMVFGKGMNGDYYFPMEEREYEDFTETAVEYRHIIENGYLQLLLTGGIVHIILFLLLLLPAAILGIFRSSNQFTMACGMLILLWVLDMLIYGLPRLSLHYILIWICVGICFKPSIRRMTNNEINAEFQKANLY